MNVRLHDLLLDAAVTHSPLEGEITVEGLSCDSRTTSPGDLFFALPGLTADGARFASDAVRRGAVAVVAERDLAGCGAPAVVVPDARIAMAELAASFHGKPSKSLKVAGVTGTNGKTTVTFLCRHILDAVHRRCGLIGTIKYVVGDREIEAPRTTPESIDLQRLMAGMLDEGCKSVAMEVSSHALAQHRVHGIDWDAAIFTNLTQDHLDYHKTMEAYFEAKTMLFQALADQSGKKGRAVINSDDRYGHLLAERFEKSLNIVTYGLGARAAFRATDTRFDALGSTFHLEAKGRKYFVRLPLIGSFNIYNALAALAATASMGVEVRAAVAALAQAPQVPGRLERVPARRHFQVFVDYAHTEDALTNVLHTLADLQPGRLIAVVGCGGDRDRGKRPLMAAAAEALADRVILTSDNPRSEDPDRILADMKAGLRANRHEIVRDREEAIRRAVAIAEPGDIVLIAGKGHETYQEARGARTEFDDVKVAQRAIEYRPVDLGPREPPPTGPIASDRGEHS